MKIDINKTKKDLYKSKVMAKFSHYLNGKIYYTVELEDGTYLFPIYTIEDITYEAPEHGIIFDAITLSSDLGETTFYSEIKGSDLNRWIAMAIKTGDFLKIK